MLNQVVLVGRLTKEVELKEGENYLELAVPRSPKNENGISVADVFKFKIGDRLAENTAQYCRTGDIVGIKGRLKNEDGKINVEVEKVTFLSSKSGGRNDE